MELREVTDANRADVVAVRLGPGQDRYVSSVADSLEEAADHPEGNPWFRAVYDGDHPVGFVMLSWDVAPRLPDIRGPWFLWKLIVAHDRQGTGVGREVVGLVADLVRAQGCTELLTSHVPGEGGPAGFYERLGFVPTGELDPEGEIVLSLDLRA